MACQGSPGWKFTKCPGFSASNFLVWDNTHLKFNISPLKSGRWPQKEAGSSSNHRFSGAILNIGAFFGSPTSISFMVKGLSSKEVGQHFYNGGVQTSKEVKTVNGDLSIDELTTTLPETNIASEIDPWKRRFLLETTTFRGCVSFREDMFFRFPLGLRVWIRIKDSGARFIKSWRFS